MRVARGRDEGAAGTAAVAQLGHDAEEEYVRAHRSELDAWAEAWAQGEDG